MDDVGAIEQGPWEAERISQFQLSGGTHIVIPTSGSDNNLSDGKAMRFRGTANGQFVTYRMPISEAGSYALDVKVRRGPSGARARLEWSPNGSTGWTDVSGTQEFYALSTTEEHFYLTANLSPIGQVYFRWVITGQHPSSTNRDVVTDYISLIKE
jgi:hypothetical protein